MISILFSNQCSLEHFAFHINKDENNVQSRTNTVVLINWEQEQKKKKVKAN